MEPALNEAFSQPPAASAEIFLNETLCAERAMLDTYRSELDGLWETLHCEAGNKLEDARDNFLRGVPDHPELEIISEIIKNILFTQPPGLIDCESSIAEIQKHEMIRHHHLLYALRQLQNLSDLPRHNPESMRIMTVLQREIIDELCKSHINGTSFPYPEYMVPTAVAKAANGEDDESEDMFRELRKLQRRKLKEMKRQMNTEFTCAINRVGRQSSQEQTFTKNPVAKEDGKDKGKDKAKEALKETGRLKRRNTPSSHEDLLDTVKQLQMNINTAKNDLNSPPFFEIPTTQDKETIRGQKNIDGRPNVTLQNNANQTADPSKKKTDTKLKNKESSKREKHGKNQVKDKKLNGQNEASPLEIGKNGSPTPKKISLLQSVVSSRSKKDLSVAKKETSPSFMLPTLRKTGRNLNTTITKSDAARKSPKVQPTAKLIQLKPVKQVSVASDKNAQDLKPSIHSSTAPPIADGPRASPGSQKPLAKPAEAKRGGHALTPATSLSKAAGNDPVPNVTKSRTQQEDAKASSVAKPQLKAPSVSMTGKSGALQVRFSAKPVGSTPKVDADSPQSVAQSHGSSLTGTGPAVTVQPPNPQTPKPGSVQMDQPSLSKGRLAVTPPLPKPSPSSGPLTAKSFPPVQPDGQIAQKSISQSKGTLPIGKVTQPSLSTSHPPASKKAARISEGPTVTFVHTPNEQDSLHSPPIHVEGVTPPPPKLVQKKPLMIPKYKH